VQSGGAPLWFPELHYVLSKRESMAIDRMVHGGIILAGSGFMDAGPVLRHLEESIDREDCTVVLSGYQPEGGFAWKLQRGANRAQFNGTLRDVRANTVRLEGLSGRDHRDDLHGALQPHQRHGCRFPAGSGGRARVAARRRRDALLQRKRAAGAHAPRP